MIRLNWKLTFFSLFFFLSFIKLGFWQLDRKDEKIKLIMKKAELNESQGILSSDISSATESGTPVLLKGAFDKKVILLLDNKILDGVVGFEVLHLFRDQSGLNFLVNRGFVPAARTRSENPEIPKIEDFLGAFEGYVYRQTTNPYALEAGKVDYKFPQIVQKEESFGLSRKLNKEISPFIIRMRDDQAGALPRSWHVSNIKPEKHQAYAVQWFLMSLAILIAWLSFTIRFSRNERDN